MEWWEWAFVGGVCVLMLVTAVGFGLWCGLRRVVSAQAERQKTLETRILELKPTPVDFVHYQKGGKISFKGKVVLIGVTPGSAAGKTLLKSQLGREILSINGVPPMEWVPVEGKTIVETGDGVVLVKVQPAAKAGLVMRNIVTVSGVKKYGVGYEVVTVNGVRVVGDVEKARRCYKDAENTADSVEIGFKTVFSSPPPPKNVIPPPLPSSSYESSDAPSSPPTPPPNPSQRYFTQLDEIPSSPSITRSKFTWLAPLRPTFNITSRNAHVYSGDDQRGSSVAAPPSPPPTPSLGGATSQVDYREL